MSPRQEQSFAQVVAATVAVLMTVLMSFPRTALAVDGVIEINQAKVIATGGFPFKIISFGSYRLSSNLTVSAAADGIDVNASYVDIDLNGFAIVVNTANPGINGTGNNVTVHDGKVLNTSSACAIVLGDSSVVRNVIAFGSCGIAVGSDSRVADSVANDCATTGINAGDNCRISGNTTNRNGRGIVGGKGTQVSGNSVVGNTVYGITVDDGSLIIDNVIRNTGNYGLVCLSPGGKSSGFARNVLTLNSPGNNSGNKVNCVDLGGNLCDGSPCPL